VHAGMFPATEGAMRYLIEFLKAAAAALLAVHAASAVAQHDDYPSKPVAFVVGYQPGGSTDLAARIVARDLSTAIGKPVVVENRPGAGSNIAGALVAKSAPDGYTLFVAAGALATNPSLYATMPFDPAKDLVPVIELVSLPNVIVVNPEVPARDIRELIAFAQANPDKLTCASSNPGSTGHLTCEMFVQETGVRMVQVQYKGSSGAVADLLGGHVDVLFDQIPASLEHIRSGKLRALAVTSPQRNVNLPEVPTVDEAGLPGFYSNTWAAIFAPAGTPSEIIARLNREMARILAGPEVRERLEAMGMEPVGGSPEQMAEVLRDDTAKWAAVITKGDIKLR
ncbi:MAG: Bug family tripartite tricarboxylate transporter substrate binding protein, partial [Gammaproteobacteria bacterium]